MIPSSQWPGSWQIRQFKVHPVIHTTNSCLSNSCLNTGGQGVGVGETPGETKQRQITSCFLKAILSKICYLLERGRLKGLASGRSPAQQMKTTWTRQLLGHIPPSQTTTLSKGGNQNRQLRWTPKGECLFFWVYVAPPQACTLPELTMHAVIEWPCASRFVTRAYKKMVTEILVQLCLIKTTHHQCTKHYL